MGNVRPLNQRPAADGVDDTARAQKRIQRHGTNAGSGLVVVQWRIGMRAHVGGQRDGTDIDRTARADGGAPLLAVRRIARKHRAACVNGGGNVPKLLHGT